MNHKSLKNAIELLQAYLTGWIFGTVKMIYLPEKIDFGRHDPPIPAI